MRAGLAVTVAEAEAVTVTEAVAATESVAESESVALSEAVAETLRLVHGERLEVAQAAKALASRSDSQNF